MGNASKRGIVELVPRPPELVLPAGHAGGVAVDDAVTHRLFEDPYERGEAVLHRGAAALVRDPAVRRTVHGAVRDHADGQVPEGGHDAPSPAGEVGVQGLRFEPAQREPHHRIAVLGEGHGRGLGAHAGLGEALHLVDPGLCCLLVVERLNCLLLGLALADR